MMFHFYQSFEWWKCSIGVITSVFYSVYCEGTTVGAKFVSHALSYPELSDVLLHFWIAVVLCSIDFLFLSTWLTDGICNIKPSDISRAEKVYKPTLFWPVRKSSLALREQTLKYSFIDPWMICCCIKTSWPLRSSGSVLLRIPRIQTKHGGSVQFFMLR